MVLFAHIAAHKMCNYVHKRAECSKEVEQLLGGISQILALMIAGHGLALGLAIGKLQLLSCDNWPHNWRLLSIFIINRLAMRRMRNIFFRQSLAAPSQCRVNY